RLRGARAGRARGGGGVRDRLRRARGEGLRGERGRLPAEAGERGALHGRPRPGPRAAACAPAPPRPRAGLGRAARGRSPGADPGAPGPAGPRDPGRGPRLRGGPGRLREPALRGQGVPEAADPRGAGGEPAREPLRAHPPLVPAEPGAPGPHRARRLGHPDRDPDRRLAAPREPGGLSAAESPSLSMKRAAPRSRRRTGRLVAGLAIVSLLAWLGSGPAVQWLVAREGSRALAMRVTVHRAHVGLVGPRPRLAGFALGNPPGCA